MDEKTYRYQLSSDLQLHTAEAARRIRHVLKNLPPRTRSVELIVFPTQDGDGTFSIRASLEGPDLYVLNKAIKEFADIFDVIYTEGGVEPEVPLVNPFDTGFQVNDAIADCAAQWLQQVWRTLEDVKPSIPITILADSDCATLTPIVLYQP